MPESTPEEVLSQVKSEGLEFIDFRFSDLPGVCQHVTIPASLLDEGQFTDGHGFDGSSIRGFQQIQESDMLLIVDPDDLLRGPVLRPQDGRAALLRRRPGDRRALQPRPSLCRAEGGGLSGSTGIADTSYWGPSSSSTSSTRCASTRRQPRRTTSSTPTRASGTPAEKGPTSASSPEASRATSRYRPSTSSRTCARRWRARAHDVGVAIEVHHHEVGQRRSDRDRHAFRLAAEHGRQGAHLQVHRQGCRVAERLDGDLHAQADLRDNGSGMHTHQSLWKDGEPLFYDKDGYARLSDTARWYIGGLLQHAPAVLAFAARPPTATGVWCRATRRRSSSRTASATVAPAAHPAPTARAPRRSGSSSAARTRSQPVPLVRRLPDGRPRRHHARIEPPEPVDTDLYDLEGEEKARVPRCPGRSTRCSTPSRSTTTSSRPVACSPTTSSTCASPTSARTRSTRCACAPIPTSSPSTTTSEPDRRTERHDGRGLRAPPCVVRAVHRPLSVRREYNW